ncbi:MAG: RNA polymerase sigma factor [Euzebyaceae bacterium]|nr:RNA polymerase sigma factor [Euzebyaceae bacterium]
MPRQRDRPADADHRERFEAIYNAYSHVILAYALRRTARAEDAGDIVAETFVTAWRRIADVPAGDDARLWLYGVARRTLANYHRGRGRHTQLVARLHSDLPRLVNDATTDIAERPDTDTIVATFTGLSHQDQELLALVGWDELGHNEIATVLGCSQATVRVRLHRARKRFDRALREAGVQRSTASGHESGEWAIARRGKENVL